MGVLAKVVAGIVKESVGSGQYLIHGVIVVALIYLWNK